MDKIIKRPTKQYQAMPVPGSTMETKNISTSQEAYNYIKKFYYGDISVFESFYVLTLNRANNTLGWTKISQGGTHGTVVDIKLIALSVIDTLSAGVILAHNHPSGNVIPSQADKDTTYKVKSALNLFGVSVIDHIILSGISDNKYYSFADNGDL